MIRSKSIQKSLSKSTLIVNSCDQHKKLANNTTNNGPGNKPIDSKDVEMNSASDSESENIPIATSVQCMGLTESGLRCTKKVSLSNEKSTTHCNIHRKSCSKGSTTN